MQDMRAPLPVLFTHGAMLVAVFAVLVSTSITNAEAGARGQKRTEVHQIIVHATGGPFCERGRVRFSPAGTVEGIKRFFERSSSVSIHYIVGPDGEVARSVPEDEVAFHPRDQNEDSIGIELINAGDGEEPYPQAQVDALVKLVASIRRRWNIPLSAVKGHEDVDRSTFVCGGEEVRRKQDPGPLFPWDRVRRNLEVAARQRG